MGSWIKCRSNDSYFDKCNFYEILDDGSAIRSIDRHIIDKRGGNKFLKGKILSPWLDQDGYASYGFSIGNQIKAFRRSRIVGFTFHYSQYFNGAQIRHLDGSKSNDYPNNICWGTAYENSSIDKKNMELF